MVSKRRARKFISTAHNSWTDDFVYRREAVEYRHTRWLTDAEVFALLDQLAATFDNGRGPTVSLYYSSRNNLGGHFKVTRKQESIRIRGTGINRSDYIAHGVDSRCRAVEVKYHGVPPFRFAASSVLHEFAHYLAWRWWADGSHHGAWSSVNEALQEWFSHKRGPKVGAAYRVTMTQSKLISKLGA